MPSADLTGYVRDPASPRPAVTIGVSLREAGVRPVPLGAIDGGVAVDVEVLELMRISSPDNRSSPFQS